MDNPKCRLCGQRHASWEAHVFADEPKKKKEKKRIKVKRQSAAKIKSDLGVTAEDEAVVEAVVRKVVGGCPNCGADGELFEDAAKWRNYREKKAEYMRKRRKG